MVCAAVLLPLSSFVTLATMHKTIIVPSVCCSQNNMVGMLPWPVGGRLVENICSVRNLHVMCCLKHAGW